MTRLVGVYRLMELGPTKSMSATELRKVVKSLDNDVWNELFPKERIILTTVLGSPAHSNEVITECHMAAKTGLTLLHKYDFMNTALRESVDLLSTYSNLTVSIPDNLCGNIIARLNSEFHIGYIRKLLNAPITPHSILDAIIPIFTITRVNEFFNNKYEHVVISYARQHHSQAKHLLSTIPENKKKRFLAEENSRYYYSSLLYYQAKFAVRDQLFQRKLAEFSMTGLSKSLKKHIFLSDQILLQEVLWSCAKLSGILFEKYNTAVKMYLKTTSVYCEISTKSFISVLESSLIVSDYQSQDSITRLVLQNKITLSDVNNRFLCDVISLCAKYNYSHPEFIQMMLSSLNPNLHTCSSKQLVILISSLSVVAYIDTALSAKALSILNRTSMHKLPNNYLRLIIDNYKHVIPQSIRPFAVALAARENSK